jgi:predicted RNA-binding protein with RPS1 domain
MIEDQMTPTGVAQDPAEEQPAQAAVSAPAEDAGITPSPEPAPADAEVQADAPIESEAPSAEVEEVPAQEAAAAVEPAPEAAPTSVEPIEAPQEGGSDDSALFDEYMRNMDSEERGESGGGTISRGDKIEAEVIQVEDNRVFVNLGTKAEGVVPLEELTDEKVLSAVGIVKPGDRFEVVVLKTSNAEGNPVVSKKKADFDQQWRRILEAQESGEVFRATVVDRVKGGLVVDIGVRGFVPATHVGSGKLRNIEKYVGETITVKIIEVDKERRKVVLSNRMAEEERKEEVKKDLFGKVKVGDVLPGTVRRLTDYGAFVDLGGIDGLLHISEMSWMRIDHPQEVLKVGQEINVLVLRLDENTGRISLGLRQVLPDPWSLVKDHYTLGQKIQVKVTRMVQSGAFVRLPEQAEAFLPLSEISDKRLKKPQDALEINQDIEPMIIDLKPEDRRMVLSLREGAVPGAYRGGMDGSMMGMGGMGRGPMQGGRRPMGGPPGRGGRGRDREPDFDAPNVTTRTPTGGATIGERLGALKGFFKNDAPAETTEDAETS